MLHLPIERLAELVEGGATPPEREHLLACASCTRELEAYRRLVVMAGDERRHIAPPLTSWDSLGSRLRAEGLMGVGVRQRRARHHLVIDGLRKAAAVVVFVGGGLVLGRMSAGMSVADAVAFRGASAMSASMGEVVGDGSGAMLAGDPGEGFATTQDALAALETAQRQYLLAANYLSSSDTTSGDYAPEQYRTRLAALDRTAATMQAAMRDAPADPYINQYYLATLSAREQTLRRLGTTLPVGSRLGRF